MSMHRCLPMTLVVVVLAARGALAAPAGYVKQTIPLNAPPVGLAFDSGGVLFALENAGFGKNVATLRTILPDGSFGTSFPVVGDDDSNFFVGSMAYDPVADRLLITDNTADGRLYAVDSGGVQQTIATGLAGAAGVAVRSSGEIFVSTSPFGSPGEVLLVDDVSGASTPVLGGLGFGAGLAFDSDDHLIVQDADAATFAGRLQRLPTSGSPGGLVFGPPQPIADGLISSAGLAVDSEGDIFTTGVGGLYVLSGSPPVETPFDSNGRSGQFATAIAFDPGSRPFEPFAGPDAGRLALMADFGFAMQDSFITLLAPAQAEDFNSDGGVDGDDLAIWATGFGTDAEAHIEDGDADRDGDIDGHDFLLWQRAVNGGPQPFASRFVATAAVPEPAVWKLIPGIIAIFLGKSVIGSNVKRSSATAPFATG